MKSGSRSAIGIDIVEIKRLSRVSKKWGKGFLKKVYTDRELAYANSKRFPYQQKLADVLDLKIMSPRLALLPDTNRIGTELDLNLLERIGGRTYTGTMALDYGLRFERSDNTVRMTGVRVSSVRLNDVPEPFNGAISRHMPRMAEQLLSNYALHTFSDQDMSFVSGLGFEPGEIKVTPKGLRVTLDPMLPK